MSQPPPPLMHFPWMFRGPHESNWYFYINWFIINVTFLTLFLSISWSFVDSSFWKIKKGNFCQPFSVQGLLAGDYPWEALLVSLFLNSFLLILPRFLKKIWLCRVSKVLAFYKQPEKTVREALWNLLVAINGQVGISLRRIYLFPIFLKFILLKVEGSSFFMRVVTTPLFLSEALAMWYFGKLGENYAGSLQ